MGALLERALERFSWLPGSVFPFVPLLSVIFLARGISRATDSRNGVDPAPSPVGTTFHEDDLCHVHRVGEGPPRPTRPRGGEGRLLSVTGSDVFENGNQVPLSGGVFASGIMTWKNGGPHGGGRGKRRQGENPATRSRKLSIGPARVTHHPVSHGRSVPHDGSGNATGGDPRVEWSNRCHGA